VIAILVSSALAFLVAVLATSYLIKFLRAYKIGQQIREDGPKRHVSKAGTPTMGGIVILLGVLVGYLGAHANLGIPISSGGLLVLFAALGAGLVGFLDDFIKIRKARSLGLTKSAKILGQIIVAGLFAFGAHFWAHVPSSIDFVRFSGFAFHVPVWAWIVFATLVVIGSSNAVNLTDGLDGLAAGSAIFAFGCLTIIGYWQFRHESVYHVSSAIDIGIITVAMCGALAGFLWWNAAPAKIFMGDTGSLAIGAALGATTLIMGLDLWLAILAGLFVIVTLSVVIQVISFRVFHRRVFRMAPLHHHFELIGWPETTVIVRFWMMAGIFTAIALGLFYADFLSIGNLIKQ
ncbi:unnamed protein product, partial [Acidithrix sp. C25]